MRRPLAVGAHRGTLKAKILYTMDSFIAKNRSRQFLVPPWDKNGYIETEREGVAIQRDLYFLFIPLYFGIILQRDLGTTSNSSVSVLRAPE